MVPPLKVCCQGCSDFLTAFWFELDFYIYVMSMQGEEGWFALQQKLGCCMFFLFLQTAKSANLDHPSFIQFTLTKSTWRSTDNTRIYKNSNDTAEKTLKVSIELCFWGALIGKRNSHLTPLKAEKLLRFAAKSKSEWTNVWQSSYSTKKNWSGFHWRKIGLIHK